jgi:major vault protein
MVLAPGEYAYVQDESKGQIKVHVGPTLINQTAQDRPVIFDPATKSFKRVGLEQAVRPCPVASEGDYVILENPSSDERNKFPPEGTVAVVAPSLKSGRKINISGPCTFGLWPMQIATVVPGHHLRSNQYLLVRITGEENAIYYPRVEHSIIRYGDKQKHYATAVPAGEGRYVMDRNTGEINTEKGPKMLLPDPRRYVIVRRMLSDKQCNLWYPGNDEALKYNQSLREIAKESPSNRSGFVSERDVAAAAAAPAAQAKRLAAAGGSMRHAFPASYSNVGGALEAYGSAGETESMSLMDQSVASVVGESFERGTAYTPPRTITLDTKYDGVPSITVWTGYAVLIVSKTGKRRVEVGPQTILLDYDESLEVLAMSTGKPKNTDKLEKTVYLRVSNNKVSDHVSIMTKDKVKISAKLSYRVNFEGEDPNLWFQVENYVKFLCDHARSILKGLGQKKTIEEMDSQGVDIIRDVLLGQSVEGKRPGMFFEDNGMRVDEVEILGIDIEDQKIAKILDEAQHAVVTSNIDLRKAEKELEVTTKKEEISRKKLSAEWLTQQEKNRLEKEKLDAKTTLAQATFEADKANADKEKVTKEAVEAVADLVAQRKLARDKSSAEQATALAKENDALVIAKEKAITENVVERFKSAQVGFSEACVALSQRETLTRVAEAMSVQQFIGGNSLAEVLLKVLGNDLSSLIKKADERGSAGPANGPSIPAGVSGRK